jgi:heme-degrading monooxygenase HmoA
MFIAMNRFRITPGREEDFIAVWKQRDSYLKDVPGFKDFHLLRGPGTDEYTLFASHSVWESKQDFENWTHSEAFRLAHANAGQTKGIYQGHPNLELFEAVL